MADILQATIALREQAWADVQVLPAFAQFLALDAAVVAMGGESLIAPAGMMQATTSVGNDGVERRLQKFARPSILKASSKISHAEAAYAALVKAGHPLTSVELLDAAMREGAKIGGEKPIVNLTSTLSRNAEFINERFDGVPHWWLADKPLPHNWSMARNDALNANQFDISSMLGEKGDDDDGAAIENALD